MITLKINKDEVALECDGTKDFKELTTRENLDKIRSFAKTYNDEVVKPHCEMEAQIMKENNVMVEATEKAKREHDIKMMRISEEMTKRSDLRYTITDVIRKTGSAIGIGGAILGVLKIADKILSGGNSPDSDESSVKKIVEKKEEKKEVSKKK